MEPRIFLTVILKGPQCMQLGENILFTYFERQLVSLGVEMNKSTQCFALVAFCKNLP